MTRNNISEVAYTVQTTRCNLHNIPIDFKVTNENDSKAMGGIATPSQNYFGKPHTFTAIYDKGYHTQSEFDCANSLELMCWWSFPSVSAHAPDLALMQKHLLDSQ
jgi:hypothetical protein